MTAVESPLLFEPSCLVGGREEHGAARFDVRYPYTGEVVGSAPSLDAQTVAEALDLAGAAKVRLDRFERSGVLERVADAIAAHATELSRLISFESGLCLKDTTHEIERAIDVFRFASREALRDDGEAYAGDVSVNGRARRGFTTREPVRLVAAITPFNHPLNQVAHKLAPAIAAGAPIVLKPSERTPLAGLWLGRAVIEVGYPEDALAVVTGDPDVVAGEMLAHEAVEVVSFTGGVAVGRQIAKRLGTRRAVLELGGNDPLIVLADADLERAATLAVEGATRNSGQRCTAVKRILAEHSIAAELADLVAARTAELRVGDPFDPETDVGTLIDAPAAQLVAARVEAAVRSGAVLRHGGERHGAQLVPPVLTEVGADVELVVEETFGPAVPIVPVSSCAQAIDVANSTRYGLSAGVVSNDLDAIMTCVRELRCGTVNVDEVPGFRTENAPFGGVKASGTGAKEGVVEAIRGYTNVKLVTLPWPR